MKIAVSGDWHLGLTLGAYDFFDDISEAVKMFVDETHSVDLAVVLGDIFHTNRPSPRDLAFAIEMFYTVGCPIIVIPGNHDVGVDVEFDSLAPLRKCCYYMEHSVFTITPIIYDILGLRVGLCGYIRDNVAKERGFESAQDCVNKFFDECRNKKVDYIFTHLDINGSDLGGGVFMKGGSLNMPLSIAKKLPCEIFNGHIHKRQRMGKNIWMPGSIVPVSFGDIKQKKGYFVIER